MSSIAHPADDSEKLQAIAGPWSDFIQEILKKYVMGDGCLQQFINFDFTRARPFSAIVSAAMICYALPENKVSPSASSMATFTKRTDEVGAAGPVYLTVVAAAKV